MSSIFRKGTPVDTMIRLHRVVSYHLNDDPHSVERWALLILLFLNGECSEAFKKRPSFQADLMMSMHSIYPIHSMRQSKIREEADHIVLLRKVIRSPPPVILELVECHGVDMRMYDDFALREAVGMGYASVVHVLCTRCGANVNSRYGSALVSAVEKRHVDVVELLCGVLDADASVYGGMALVYASENGDMRTMAVLLRTLRRQLRNRNQTATATSSTVASAWRHGRDWALDIAEAKGHVTIRDMLKTATKCFTKDAKKSELLSR
jgi:hypothetical protein